MMPLSQVYGFQQFFLLPTTQHPLPGIIRLISLGWVIPGPYLAESRTLLQSVLGSSGCHNEIPQTGGLIEIYLLLILDARSLRSGCQPSPVVVGTLFLTCTWLPYTALLGLRMGERERVLLFVL